MNSNFETIKSRVDIVAHIRQYHSLESSGNILHGDHGHQSVGGRCLVVYSDTASFSCHSCATGGSVIDFEMERLNCTNSEAVELLADFYNIELQNDFTPEQKEAFSVRTEQIKSVQGLLHKAFLFYHDNLTETDREYLYGRCLTDETINENLIGKANNNSRDLVKYLYDYCSDKQTLLSTGLFYENDGRLNDAYSNGIVIPYWHFGKPLFSIIRREGVEPSQKFRKHLTQTEKRPFISEAVRHITWGGDSIDKEKPTIIVEGIFDALSAKQELGTEFNVISPITTRPSAEQIGELADIIIDKHIQRLTIVTDNDKNEAGQKGANATESNLRTAIVAKLKAKYDSLPDSHDDKSDGEDNYVKDRKPWILITKLPKPPERDNVDVNDYLVNGRHDDLRYWIKSGRTAWQIKAQADGNPSRFKMSDSFKEKLLCDEMRSETFYHSKSKRLYHYEHGVYNRDSDENQALFVANQKLDVEQSSSRTKSTVTTLMTSTYSEESNKDNIVNCLNGLFDLEEKTLKPHSPWYVTKTQINANWNPDAKCPKVESFLDDVLDEECQESFWEFLGYCLIPDVRFHQSLIMIGSGNNGKSTALDVVKIFLGIANVSAVSLHAMEENKYSTSLIYDKMANICADIPSTHLEKTDQFKNISAGDAVMIEEKYKTAFPEVLNCKLLFSANKMPTTSDRTNAFMRRWVPIMFDKTIPANEVIPGFIKQLTTQEELDGIFVKAIAGLESAISRGKVMVPEVSKKFLADYQSENDVVVEFMNECITESDETVTNSDMFQYFKSYCEGANRKAVGKNKFLKRLKELMPENAVCIDTNLKKFGYTVTINIEEPSFTLNDTETTLGF